MVATAGERVNTSLHNVVHHGTTLRMRGENADGRDRG